jgi:heme a synthase
MPTYGIAAADTASGGGGAALRRCGRLALFAAAVAYALVASAGRLHAVLAAGTAIAVIAVLAFALVHRAAPGFGGRGGVVRPLLLAVVLLAVQALLGMAAARMAPTWHTGAAQFLAAILLVATLLVATVRAGTFGSPDRAASAGAAADGGAARQARKAWGAALGAVILGLIVVTFGAITTRMPGAAVACQGFPLCSGQLVPAGAAPAHVHWAHRLLAYLLFFHVLGATIAAVRRGAPAPVRRAVVATFALIVLQIIVGAGLVLMHLASGMQTIHLVVGTASWCALVVWAGVARRWRAARVTDATREPLVRA